MPSFSKCGSLNEVDKILQLNFSEISFYDEHFSYECSIFHENDVNFAGFGILKQVGSLKELKKLIFQGEVDERNFARIKFEAEVE